MKKLKQNILIPIAVLFDFLTVALSFTLSFRLNYGLIRTIPSYYLQNQSIFIISSFFILVFLHITFDLFTNCQKAVSTPVILRLLTSAVFTSLMLLVIDRIVRLGLPFEVMIINAAFVFLFSLLSRLCLRWMILLDNRIRHAAQNDQNNRVAIYGAGDLGQYLAEKMQSDLSLGQPVVFLDDAPSLIGKKVSSMKVVGTLDSLEKILFRYGVDELVIAIDRLPTENLRRAVQICRQKSVAIKRFGLSEQGAGRVADARMQEICLEDLLHRDSVELNMQIVEQMLDGATVLVTGAVGSIGSEICRQVLRFGVKKCLLLDINENGLFAFDRELAEQFDQSRYEIFVGSIRDRTRISQIIQQHHPQIVLHAAAHKHVPLMQQNPLEAIKNNVFGTLNVAQAAIQGRVERFILISTDKAVNPTNIMGASKRVAEIIIQMLNSFTDCHLSAVRFGNVLGSQGSVVPIFQKQIESGGPVTITHPDMMRYFMTIPEAVQLVLEAGAMAKGSEIFVLDMGKPVKIYDLACDLIRLYGLTPDRDIPIVITGLRPGEKMFEEISLEQETCTKTGNNKIFINRSQPQQSSVVSEILDSLQMAVADNDLAKSLQLIEQLVPTYQKNA